MRWILSKIRTPYPDVIVTSLHTADPFALMVKHLIYHLTDLYISIQSTDSIAYSFGGGGGLMKFKFNKMADTKKDWIAFGLSSVHEDAVLVRLIGKADFIQVEMVCVEMVHMKLTMSMIYFENANFK